MEKDKIGVGLDIGTTKIVAMIGKMNEYGKLEILGVGKSKSFGVQRGVVSNISKTIHSIQAAISEAQENSGYKINDVVVGIAGQHIRSLQHSDYISRSNPDDVISEEDVMQLISQVQKLNMLPGEEIIHVLPQEYKIDGQTETNDPIGMSGCRLESDFHVVVGQAASIRNVGRCVKGADVELANLTLEPLASADAVLSQEEKEAGVALIDIGGGTTDLAIFKDGIIRHTAVIPFGGNVITEDIKEGCFIIEKQAEKLKVQFGSAWPGENKENEIVTIPGVRDREHKEISLKNLSKIIHARVVEIIEQAYAEIKAYGHEQHRKKLIAGIVLTGGGAQLKHIKQLVEYITGMDTRIGYPNEHLAGETSEEISSPMYATSVGLVMHSLRTQSSQGAVSMAEIEAKMREEREKIEEEERRKREIEKLTLQQQEAIKRAEERKAQEERARQLEEEKRQQEEQLRLENEAKKKKGKTPFSFLDSYVEKVKEFLDKAE